MEEYLLKNLAELAERRARNIREEAMMWDILSRDLKREAKRREERTFHRPTRPAPPVPDEELDADGRLYVRVKDAKRIMGMGHSSIYVEIKEGRLPIKKVGRKTLISMQAIHEWFANLPDA